MDKQSNGEHDGGRRAHDEGAEQPKRPYRTPRLTTYGSLRDLALVKGGAKSDGGSPAPNSKT